VEPADDGPEAARPSTVDEAGLAEQLADRVREPWRGQVGDHHRGRLGGRHLDDAGVDPAGVDLAGRGEEHPVVRGRPTRDVVTPEPSRFAGAIMQQ
jgi:hypothetical protein